MASLSLSPFIAAAEPADAVVTARELLTERTRALMLEAATADPPTRQRILDEVVTDHLWLAESLSRRFARRGQDDDDLLQVARIGLIEAAMRFDPERGPFVAFAVPTITGVLKRHFRDHGWLVRPPRRTQEVAAGIWAQWPALAQRLGSIPNERDLAWQLGESLTAVHVARCASQSYSPASIDAALERGISFETRETEQSIGQLEARLVVTHALEQLDDSERELLRLRYFEERSQADIATAIGTSQMQVSRLLARVLGKLRTIVGSIDELPVAV